MREKRVEGGIASRGPCVQFLSHFQDDGKYSEIPAWLEMPSNLTRGMLNYSFKPDPISYFALLSVSRFTKKTYENAEPEISRMHDFIISLEQPRRLASSTTLSYV